MASLDDLMGNFPRRSHNPPGLGMERQITNAELERQAQARPSYVTVDSPLLKALGGEGSRGGKVVSHTPSGKPIYSEMHRGYSGGAAGVKRAYPDYHSEDHEAAARFHRANGNDQAHQAHMKAADELRSDPKTAMDAYKPGAQSPPAHSVKEVSPGVHEVHRGGNLIGTATKSPHGGYTSRYGGSSVISGVTSNHDTKDQAVSHILASQRSGIAKALEVQVRAGEIVAKAGFTLPARQQPIPPPGPGAALVKGGGGKCGKCAKSLDENGACPDCGPDGEDMEPVEKCGTGGMTQKIAKALALQAECAQIVAKAWKPPGDGTREGSRGGHVIGHTKSGKPIYEVGHADYGLIHSGGRLRDQGVGPKTSGEYLRSQGQNAKDSFPDYSAQDHEDAADKHDQKAESPATALNDAKIHYRVASAHRAAALAGDVAKGLKDWSGKPLANQPYHKDWSGKPQSMHAGSGGEGGSGEGSRGGHVLGHTQSGKPIYGHGHGDYGLIHSGSRLRAQGVGAKTSGEHLRNQGRAAKESFPDYSDQDHMDAAEKHESTAAAPGTSLEDSRGHLNAAMAHRAAGMTPAPEPSGHEKFQQLMASNHPAKYRPNPYD